jgi:hypothetical protein
MSCAHTSAAEEKEKKRRNALAKIQRKCLNETTRAHWKLFFFLIWLDIKRNWRIVCCSLFCDKQKKNTYDIASEEEDSSSNNWFN